MGNRYIYKLYFTNGCTYVGKHCQKYDTDDGYITSSSYYSKHKDLLERREILIDNLPDIDTLDIMESLCIMSDICDNPLNVNYNRGAWLDPSKFDRGFSGPANGMYGRKMTDFISKEKLDEMVSKQVASRRENFQKKVEAGYVPASVRKAKRQAYNKQLREINKQIKAAHKEYENYIKSLPKRWYYNETTLKETYWYELPEGDGWHLGRLPHNLWSEERKSSYADKHNFNPYRNKTVAEMEEYSKLSSERQKGKVCYTDGESNIYLHQGQDIPEGFYKGCSFEKSELYWQTRKKAGYNNKGEKVNG